MTRKKRAIGGCNDGGVMICTFKDVHRHELACFGAALGKFPTAQEVHHIFSAEYVQMYKIGPLTPQAVR